MLQLSPCPGAILQDRYDKQQLRWSCSNPENTRCALSRRGWSELIPVFVCLFVFALFVCLCFVSWHTTMKLDIMTLSMTSLHFGIITVYMYKLGMVQYVCINSMWSYEMLWTTLKKVLHLKVVEQDQDLPTESCRFRLQVFKSIGPVCNAEASSFQVDSLSMLVKTIANTTLSTIITR